MTSLNSVNNSGDILLVDDDPDALRALRRVLEKEQYQTRFAESAKDALISVKKKLPTVVLLDLGLPDSSGLELLRSLLSEGVKHVIIISGTDSAETTRQCLREGAFDFLLKPARRNEILQAVGRATSSYQVNQVRTQEYPVELKPGFGALATPSAASQIMFRQLKQIAGKTEADALITGAAGLFKRDIAALLHHYTNRSGSALLINCALEIDHKACDRFSGSADYREVAEQSNGGYLERASNGTLILDDLSLLPLSVQEILEKHIKRTGKVLDGSDTSLHKSRCNIIGILKEPVADALSNRRLLPALHTVLAENVIEVPALKDRPEDISFFATHAVAQLNALLGTEKSLSPGFLDYLTNQSWDGNLIELKNRLLTAYRGTENGEEIVFDPMHWPTATNDNKTYTSFTPNINTLIGTTLADAEMKLITATLASVDNNKSKAAKILGISVKTLYNRLKK